MSENPELLTMGETGKILRASRSTVYRMIGGGELRAYKVRGRLVIDRASVLEAIRPVIPKQPSTGSGRARYAG